MNEYKKQKRDLEMLSSVISRLCHTILVLDNIYIQKLPKLKLRL